MLDLPDSAVLLKQHAADWRAAVLLAGAALEASGAVTAEYGQRMVAMVEEYGAYIVIAPGLALAHARPGDDVLRAGMAVVTLAEPVVFGHPYNDPVTVVLGLAVLTADEHVTGIAELANVFNETSVIGRLAEAASIDEVRAALGVPAPPAPPASLGTESEAAEAAEAAGETAAGTSTGPAAQVGQAAELSSGNPAGGPAGPVEQAGDHS